MWKFQVHIKDMSSNFNFRFIFCRLFNILRRRSVLNWMPQIFKIYLESDISYETHLEPFLTDLKEHIFIDVGAHIGLWSTRLAKKSLFVYAFEPTPKTFSVLKRRIKKHKNIIAFPYALGEKNGSVNFYLFGASSLNNVLEFSSKAIMVPMKTLDSFGFKNIGLIKIDTEGCELPILKGAQKTILENNPQLLIEVHKPEKEQIELITNFLSSLNYECHIYTKKNRSQPIILSHKNN